MNHNDLVSIVDQAINQFYRNDSFLLDVSASEWSIAHRNRGKVEIGHNLLAIEVKTANSSHDFKKLEDYTNRPNQKRPFQYQYGLALSFVPNLSLQWFHKGEELR